ncbi:hypothetical protein [Qipengyuania sphaerica]|uniref:hypothetical protein n=1 Tax=Qipengyuania sphaerica TaxID=2867243 RepID=UPI001C8699F3|nr:hypothetical protein [Qipengyuania sphaerica]MBX7540833.1 hypothetical protein [Qipengyuania sphaerica]
MPPLLEERSDCSRCAALCCIAYPSEDMPGFSASKEAGEKCPKLGKDGRCTIYETREEEGFAGCVRYECFGAGQHVTETLFGGGPPDPDPSILARMVDAFLAMRPVSDLSFLARKLARETRKEEARANAEALAIELAEIAGSCEGLFQTRALGRIERELRALYRSTAS